MRWSSLEVEIVFEGWNPLVFIFLCDFLLAEGATDDGYLLTFLKILGTDFDEFWSFPILAGIDDGRSMGLLTF